MGYALYTKQFQLQIGDYLFYVKIEILPNTTCMIVGQLKTNPVTEKDSLHQLSFELPSFCADWHFKPGKSRSAYYPSKGAYCNRHFWGSRFSEEWQT